MKTRSLVILAATAVLPLSAQTAAPAAPAAPQAVTAAALPQQRADAYAALAVIPADAEVVISVNKAAATLQALAKAGILPADALDEDTAMWEGAAVALSPQFMGNVEKLLPLYDKAQALVLAEEADTDGIAHQKAAKELLSDLAAAIKSTGKIGPVYAAVSVVPEATDKLTELYDEALKGMKEDGDFTYVEQNGMKGIMLPDLAKLAEGEESHELQPVIDALRGRSLCLMSCRVGNTLAVVLCEDPADAKLPATPAEGILGTDKLAKGDGTLDKPGFLTMYSSAAAGNMMQQMGKISPQLDAVAEIIRSAAPEMVKPEQLPACLKGVDTMMAELKKLDKAQPATKPDFVKMWVEDGSINLEMTTDAGGASFATAKQLGSPVDVALAPLYVEATTCTAPCDFNMSAVLEGAEQAMPLLGKLADMTDEDIAELEETVQRAKPMLQGISKACETLGSATTGSTMLLVQDNGGAVATGVKDRAALARGWNELLDAARLGCKAMGEDPAAVDEVTKATETTVGKATVYTKEAAELEPTAAVSDDVVAVATHPSIAARLANTDLAAAPEFSGVKFSMNLDSLSTLTKDLEGDITGAEEISEGMKEVSKVVKSISGSATIQDGTCTFRLQLHTK